MNSLFKRLTKVGFSASYLSINKTLFKYKISSMSNLIGSGNMQSFGAKRLPASKGTGGGNKVANISSRKKKQEEEDVEEEVEQPKQKTSAAKKKTATSVSKKKPAASKVSKKKKAEEEVEELDEDLQEEEEEATPAKGKKVSKLPQKAVHTLQTVPKQKSTTTESTQQKKRPPPKRKPATTEAVPVSDFPVVDLNKIGRIPHDSPLDPKIYTSNSEGIYEDFIQAKASEDTKKFIKAERDFLCNNYAPLPVICAKGKGTYIQDIDGKIYIDFLSAYSAVNLGHCNQHILNAAYDQMRKLHMTSRAFYNNVLAIAGHIVCNLFQYEKVLFMNSGVEAGESAVKIARRWGYVEKKIPNDQAKIVFAKGNFWGRSLYACATSDDPSRYEGFGPFDRSTHYMVEFGNLEDLKNLLESDSNICAVFLEPIQGENGVVIPPPDYHREVSKLCKKHNVLMILDEIQTGIGRTGYLLACQMDNVHPDMVLLGKSLSGGFYPISAVLTSRKIMDTIKPGEHGSTYGGNPLAAQVCIAAMQEIVQKPIIKNSFERGVELGLMLREELQSNRFIKEIRGRGLMYAIELWPECGYSAYDFSLWFLERGLLCKPTKKFTLR